MKTNPHLGRHHGNTSDSRSTAGITFTEVSYAPNSEFPKHHHRDACFCLVHQGTYNEGFRHLTLNTKPNSVIFRPPGEVHFDQVGAALVRCSLIEIDAEWFEEMRQNNAILCSPVDFQNGPVNWLAMRVHKEFRRFDELSTLAIEGLTLEMITAASRAIRPKVGGMPPGWLKNVKDFLHEHFLESFTLNDLADVAGVRPSYLANAFRRQCGCTSGEYLRRLRIEFACRQILLGNLPLSEIALSAGFSHQAHFTNLFKRSTGMTPAEYRIAVRNS